MRKLTGLSLILTLSFLAGFAHGKDELTLEPTFGAEITLSSNDILECLKKNPWGCYGITHLSRVHLQVESEKRYQELSKPPLGPAAIHFGIDEAVVEINTEKQIYTQYLAHEKHFQNLIFDAGKQVGLFPNETIGGGHVHIGTVFDKNPQLLRDFTVDFYNNPALSMGILGYNPIDAIHIGDMDPRNQVDFAKLISGFDNDKKDGRPWTAEYFADQMHTRVLVMTSHPFKSEKPAHTGKGFALNLLNFVFDETKGRPLMTAEMRAIRPQQNFHEFVLILKLFRARINYLAKHPSVQPEFVKGPRTFKEAQDQFRKYVRECGLNWDEYKNFGHPDWVREPDKVQRQDPFDLYNYSPSDRVSLLNEYEQHLPNPFTCEKELTSSN